MKRCRLRRQQGEHGELGVLGNVASGNFAGKDGRDNIVSHVMMVWTGQRRWTRGHGCIECGGGRRSRHGRMDEREEGSNVGTGFLKKRSRSVSRSRNGVVVTAAVGISEATPGMGQRVVGNIDAESISINADSPLITRRCWSAFAMDAHQHEYGVGEVQNLQNTW